MLAEEAGNLFYLRFGEIPVNGKSTINPKFRSASARQYNFLPQKEEGVSVYAVKQVKVNGEIKWKPEIYEMTGFKELLVSACNGERSVYLVKGEQVRDKSDKKLWGSDDEPVLDARTIKIVKRLKSTDLWHHEIDPYLYSDCINENTGSLYEILFKFH